MRKRRLSRLVAALVLVFGLAPAALAASTFTIRVTAGASSTVSNLDTVSGAVYSNCTEGAGGGTCPLTGVTGDSYAVIGSQTVAGAVYDAVYTGGAVSSAASVTLSKPTVIPTMLTATANGSGLSDTVTATVYGAAYTTPTAGTLVTFTGSAGLSLQAVSGYGATVAGAVYGGTDASGQIKLTATASSSGSYDITATYPGTGATLATIPVTFSGGVTFVGSSSSSSSSSSATAVGPSGGTLGCTDGSFTATVPAGAVPSGSSESCADQSGPPTGAPPLPANMVALSNYVTLTGPQLTQSVLATVKFNATALNGQSLNRVEVFHDGQWMFWPTTVNGSAGTAQVRVTGDATLVVLGDTQVFPDVPATYWARSYIDTLLGAGAVNGFPDGTFQPGGLLTRAQFVKMLVVSDQIAPSTTGETPFTDVSTGDWFAPYVAAAYNAGLVQGVSANSFAPNAPVTREQMAVLLSRALKLAGTSSLTYSDAYQIDTWALSGVQAATAAGYLNGFPDGTFQPLATTTRDQAAKILSLVIAGEAPGTATAASTASITASPNPMGPAGSLLSGQSIPVTLTVRNAAGGVLPNAQVYVQFQAATGGGTATVGTTALSTAPQAFTTDAGGQLTVTYKVPSNLPQSGTDTLTVSTGPGGTGVSSTDSYTFSH
ncbi:MAG TPA: S-layer homology domain-containing protein [Bacillota bacterium]|nr:S-layer homology domain-containing protein [Bacillota bacterium]